MAGAVEFRGADPNLSAAEIAVLGAAADLVLDRAARVTDGR